jgi:TM2 domain-containing membrane protein YozV
MGNMFVERIKFKVLKRNNIYFWVFKKETILSKGAVPKGHISRNKEVLSMDATKVDMFIMSNGKFFESHQIMQIRERLLAVDDSKWIAIQSLPFKDPQTSIIVSILGGGLGIDRFIIGDTGLGVGKLLTCGGLGIWTIVDWFMIQGATREKNFEKIQPFLF